MGIQRTSANDMSALRTQVATLKQSMMDFQKSSANESQTLRSQVATLKQFTTDTQKQFLTGLHDRVDFLEKVIKYQHMMIKYQNNDKCYEKKNHVTGKLMARMWELGCITQEKGGAENIRQYLNGHGGEDDWLSWKTHATEEDLMDFITAMYTAPTAPTVAYLIFTFPIVKVTITIYTTGEYSDYRKCMKKLKDHTDKWFAGWPSNMRNLPGKCKTFAEAYFTRVENVLTKLHEMKLLK